MWVNPWYSNFDPQYVYAFLRYYNNDRLLIVINFNQNESRYCAVKIAEAALEYMSQRSTVNGQQSTVKSYETLPEGQRPIGQSIAVDAACSGNPGKMEFQGVFVETGTHLFKSPVYEHGTNNIGEFLAIVYCLAWQQKNKINYPIYSDSVNAQKWVREGACKTKIVENEKNKPLFEVIRWAERWLHTNSFRVPIYKWRTEIWGEIPADFGRK
jgi:ribonuclease HI